MQSADLPAEFRALDEGVDIETSHEISATEVPREQSKLARLCEQTSSVLASVLPAPFGGHKRSILCQFFGQVQFGKGKAVKQTPSYPVPVAMPHTQQAYEQDSVAIIHQHQQPPIALLSKGRHPIQLVLEQQKRQHSAAMMMQQAQPNATSSDLKSSASVLDPAYHQRLEPPPSMLAAVDHKGFLHQNQRKTSEQPIKFSTPIAGNSFRPITLFSSQPQQSMSTSGWRIFNQSLEEIPTRGPRQASVSTMSSVTPTRRPTQASTIAIKELTSDGTAMGNGEYGDGGLKQARQMVPKLSDSSRGPQELSSRSSASEMKQRTENESPMKITTTRAPKTNITVGEAIKDQQVGDASGQLSGVRTIEITAESSSKSTTLAPASTSTTKPTSDTHQVQKREELVIASINNLTRIAFGNQLRDTVKVISKLIDRQSELFGAAKDPLQTSESQVEHQSGDRGKKLSSMSLDKLAIGKSRSTKAAQVATTTTATTKPTKKPRKQSTPTSYSSSTTKSHQKSMSTTPKPRESATSSPVRDVERKSTAALGETRRQSGPHTVSRSLSFDPSAVTSATTEGRGIGSGPGSATTPKVSDINRDKKPWQLSSRLPTLTTQRSLSWTSRSATSQAPRTSTTKVAESKSTKQLSDRVSSAATRYPWLLPDKSAYQTELFGVLGSANEVKLTTADALRDWSWPKKSLSEQLVSARQAHGVKPALVLNRLDGRVDKAVAKADSLATLKMSLTTTPTKPSAATPTTSTSQPPSGAQSRWVPTVTAARPTHDDPMLASAGSVVGAATSSMQISTKRPAAVVTTTTSSTTTVAPSSQPKSSDEHPISSSTPGVETASTRSDLNEVRATDSISKYTSYWSEANELLATTRRFYQQPMPQIAKTGEFFSAETISNWPERYQTMLASQSTPDSMTRTSPSFETTRRSGETYDENKQSSISRHRLDVPDKSDELRQTTRSLMGSLLNMTSVTVLPSNHKLISSTSPQVEDSIGDTDSTISEEEDEDITTTIQQTMQTTSRPLVPAQTTAYTFYGSQTPQAETTRAQDTATTNIKFPQVIDDYSVVTETRVSGGNPHSLRPPYYKNTQEEDGSVQPASLSDRVHVSRKLYEQLVPSMKNFVGSQNPLNQQRFNLSALKFLAKNLLSPTSNETTGDLSEVIHGSDNSDNTTSSSEADLMHDLLGISLPPNYYEVLPNDSQTKNVSFTERGILGKASTLLSNLRQLEQRRAAALLAAIRYQVPSPLVKPWDVTSDSFTLDGPSIMRDRYDNVTVRDLGHDSLRDSLLIAHLGNTIRNALLKQRVVPRDELERRLSGSRRHDQIDRRIDHSYPVEDLHANMSIFDGIGALKNISTRSLLDKLLYNTGKHNGTVEHDFHTIDLAAGNSTEKLASSEDHVENEQRSWPKYIKASEYQTASSAKPANLNANLQARHLLPRTKDLGVDSKSTGKSTKMSQDGSRGTQSSEESFDCDSRAPGFYPDAETTCRTFYHCSNTGHLLTFDCPSQTRFDERSLKCGPWYEVPCDLGRVKTRRHR